MRAALVRSVVLAASLAALAPAPALAQVTDLDRLEVLAAADRRGAEPAALTTLLAGALSADPQVRAAAATSIGRQERLEIAGVLYPLLEDPDPDVRAAAVTAAALSWSRALPYRPAPTARDRPRRRPVPAAGQRLLDAVLHRLRSDPVAAVRGAAATALGRVPWPRGPYRDRLEELAEMLRAEELVDPRPTEPLRGTVRGLVGLLSRLPERIDPQVLEAPTLRDRLLEVAAGSADPLTRRYAVAALGAWGRVPAERLTGLLADPDAEVRRLALAGLLEAEPDDARRLAMIDGALDDPELRVRLAALRQLGSLRDDVRCARALAVVTSARSVHERAAAVGQLAGCADAAVDQSLARLAGTLADSVAEWHLPLAALAGWADRDPAGSAAALLDAAEHPAWQVRAGVAPLLAEPTAGQEAAEAFERLLYDVEPNVRTAALGAALEARAVDRSLLLAAREALEFDEHELTLVAVRALASVRRRAEAESMLGALERMSARRHETSRDARLALLDALEGLNRLEEEQIERLVPFLSDFDAAVAARTAQVLERHTGRDHSPAPTPPPAVAFPSEAELARLEALEWVVTVRDRGTFVIRLWPWRAPTNAARFARLAEADAYEGLTFHRVVPNFVVQGLSPGANEYAGYPRYTRDEITDRPHLRGTVGLSTRGRDTGDGQIFVNLVDNYRLDFDYTLFGEVVEGMEVVESILAGDMVESVRSRPATQSPTASSDASS